LNENETFATIEELRKFARAKEHSVSVTRFRRQFSPIDNRHCRYIAKVCHYYSELVLITSEPQINKEVGNK